MILAHFTVCYCSEQKIRLRKRRKKLHTFSAIHLIRNHLARRQPTLVCSFLTAQHHKNTKYRFKHRKNTKHFFFFLNKVLHPQTTNKQSKKCKFKQFTEFYFSSYQIAMESAPKPELHSTTPHNRKLDHYTAPPTDIIDSTIQTK